MAPSQAGRRLDLAASLLGTHHLDLLVVTPGSDLAYLIGHNSHPSERPVFLLIQRDVVPKIVIASFESRGLPNLGSRADVLPYDETQDVYALVSRAVNLPSRHLRIAISDNAWARSLLGLQSILPGEYVYASPYLRELRMLKDEDEVALLRSAGERTDRALERLLVETFLGCTEVDVATRLRSYLQENGLRSPGAIVASGPNGASPHHSSSERVIENGDMIVLDCGGTLNGYYSDITRTVCAGEPTEKASMTCAVVQRAQEAAVRAVRPGITAETLDQVARSIIDQAGMGEDFIHRTGHGVGLDGHEDPYIVQGNEMSLETGMVFSVEPGVYVSGEFGVRIEDTVVVTESGAQSFNHVSHDLRIVS